VTTRRGFITLVGAAAWPLAARAQQRALPVIGYLSGRTAESDASMLDAVRRGLADVGYAEGRVIIQTHFADGHYDRLSNHGTPTWKQQSGARHRPAECLLRFTRPCNLGAQTCRLIPPNRRMRTRRLSAVTGDGKIRRNWPVITARRFPGASTRSRALGAKCETRVGR